MDIKIIFEDKHILVVEKPPKVPSQSDKTKDIDMFSMVKTHLKNLYPAARNPYVGLVHRLDRPVGGIMIFAKTKEANIKLSEEVRNRRFKKEYYAVVCGKPERDREELKDYLLKLGKINMSKVVKEETKNAKEALLEYEVIDSVHTDEYGILSLLKIRLKTGRHHQIRVQLANANLPLWGDNKYNKTFVKMKKWTQIALWAYSISFKHPKNKEDCYFESRPNEEFPFTLFNI
ncbi:RluA family pseudouridine synthase [Paramaledivibacter caminithermalis]|jgi:23S rRNA pseudouridine1911/1915/1917 synthase|uniref:RNA pseudouridylate synthase n=1 Tax=Paramaledivibacter caminithermalis (strain DSM 15212 / CIP 107654 / DViRD3) TaxID=1121301 RepID=A0A1M6P796_PARC5|nr:RNA pseudouridine synthase [Paramaledivibacter caminithermalis]SHK03867.1 23S rRNA pseudouridine1911/1915/1917 synthase [Paramaledivibacter caminithermalis DSM 15212]